MTNKSAKYIYEQAAIDVNYRLAADYYQMDFDAPGMAALAKPGQFVMVGVGGEESYDPFLPRPMGINIIDRQRGKISIIYQVVGRGSRLLAAKQAGDTCALLGPLGNGWPLDIGATGGKALLVGGGTGCAPLLPLASELARRGIAFDVLLGARNADGLLCRPQFAAYADKLAVATEDGSAGTQGLVSLLFPPQASYEVIYTCGPQPMMKAASRWAKELDVRCLVSLEEHMACGIGACMGCVTLIKTPDGKEQNLRICCDGPVFDSREVLAWL